MTQTSDGNMWFSSHTGIARYDGVKWENVNGFEEPQRNLKMDHCRADSGGRIWGVNSEGIFYFADGLWRRHISIPGARYEHCKVFAALYKEGRHCLLVSFGEGPLQFWNGERWAPIRWSGNVDDPEVHIAQASRSFFWASTAAGVFRIDPLTGTGLRLDASLPDWEACGMAYDEINRELWLVAPTWIGTLSGEISNQDGLRFDLKKAGLDLSATLASQGHYSMAPDGAGGAWFGNLFSVFHFTPRGTLRRIRKQNGLIAEGLTDLLLDREHNLWIASLRGITKITSQRFLGFDRESGLLADEVSAITQGPDGQMIFGHFGGMSVLEQEIRIIPIDFADVLSCRVMDMTWGPNQMLWASLHLAGLGRVDAEARLHRLRNGENEQFNSVQFDDTGDAWVGTSLGLHRLRNGQWSSVNTPGVKDGAPLGIRRLTRGKNNTIYAATSGGGVIGIRNGTIVAWEHDESCRNVFSVLERQDGEVLSGCSEGLGRLENGRFKLSEKPRIRRPVYSLLEDSSGNLWVGTDQGVYRWSGKALSHFNRRNGLIGGETNRAALFEDAEKRIWIGTDRGVSCYDPALDVARPARPICHPTYVDDGNEHHDLSESFSLPPSADDLTFHFAAASFVDEDRIRFRWRLENFDESWSKAELRPNRSVRYPNLPAGEYRFQIQAIAADGRTSRIATSAVITIQFSPWASPWFFAILTLIAATLIVAGSIFWNQARYTRELQREVNQRARRLRSAGRQRDQVVRIQSLGVLAGGIAHSFNNALTTITGYLSLINADPDLKPEHYDYLREIEQACERAEALTFELLTFSHGGTPRRRETALDELIQETVDSVLSGTPVNVDLDIPGGLQKPVIDPEQFRQVFRNLIENAQRAMPKKGHIRIEVREESPAHGEQGLRILFEDNGTGIAPEIRDRIFEPYFTTRDEANGLGLTIAHSIIRKHGGKIEVSSNDWHGATFRFTIPVHPSGKKPDSTGTSGRDD